MNDMTILDDTDYLLTSLDQTIYGLESNIKMLEGSICPECHAEARGIQMSVGAIEAIKRLYDLRKGHNPYE